MKKKLLNICLFLPFVISIYYDPVSPGVYDWKQPEKSIDKNLRTSVLFEGSAFDMEWLQMSANVLATTGKKALKLTVPRNEEHLYIIKRGILQVTKGDSSFSLQKGSIMVLLPGENFFLQSNSCEYFLMKYRSKLSIEKDKGEKAGGTIIKDWSKKEFKPHDRGGVRSFFERPTAMLKRMEMHATTLNAGLNSHAPHTHLAKEIIVMMEGDTEMHIGEKSFKGKEGSVYFIESNVLHGIRNTGTTPCTYFAIQFE